jgi:hypothetical protein
VSKEPGAVQVQAKGTAEANEWFESLIDRNRWHQLYLWIAALKLVQEPKLLPILNGQKDNLLGFSEFEAFKLLVAPGCTWDRSIRNLSRLDFVVRDLAFAGTLGIQLDVDNLVAAANAEHPDWSLLDKLSEYMSETLYESVPAQTASVLFQRALAALLINGKVSLEQLFGIDLQRALDDEHLRDVMLRTAAGREALEPDRRESWHAWPINTFIDINRVPCELERDITGHNKGHLSLHVSKHATCLKLRANHTLAIAISHQSLAARPDAAVFVKLCRSILHKQYPKLVPGQLTDALLEGLIDQKCQHALPLATERLSKLPVELKTLRKAANVVNNRASGQLETSGNFSFMIGGYEYPIRGDPQELQISTMHAALSGNDTVRGNLGISVEDASELLWAELLRWQTVYFGLRPTQAVLSLADEAQKNLGARVAASAATAAEDLEVYALLEALKHPDKGVSFRVTLPNVKIVNERGLDENEYDVVSVVLKEDKHVEVWVWGVTTETNLSRKRTADLAKIQKLKDLLGGRWEADVRVATSYVHKDGNDICCEIDGRQERRTLGF